MANYRIGRINDQMKKEIAGILRDIKDPRVSGSFVSVTGCEVTSDLKFAKVYYSVLTGDRKDVAKGLKSSAGFIRRQIAQNMNLRITPELTFVEDNSIEYGAKIEKILRGIEITPEAGDEPDGEGK